MVDRAAKDAIFCQLLISVTISTIHQQKNNKANNIEPTKKHSQLH